MLFIIGLQVFTSYYLFAQNMDQHVFKIHLLILQIIKAIFHSIRIQFVICIV